MNKVQPCSLHVSSHSCDWKSSQIAASAYNLYMVKSLLIYLNSHFRVILVRDCQDRLDFQDPQEHLLLPED